MIYLDTSALIKLYVLEEGSERVQDLVESQDEPLPVWELQEMELINALRLQVFWKGLTRKESEKQIRLFFDRRKAGLYFFPEVDRGALLGDFHLLSEQTPKTGCRTMDILHVACARRLGVSVFMSFDERQGRLAKSAGLSVVN